MIIRDSVLLSKQTSKSKKTVDLNPDNIIAKYSYDTLSRRTKLEFPSNDTFTNYTYDQINRLTSLKNSKETISLRRTIDPRRIDIDNEVIEPIIPGEPITIPQSRISPLHSTSETISKFSYTYDNAGNRLTEDRKQNSEVSNSTYGYDDIYQLTSTSGSQTHNYDYDNVGNREEADAIHYTPNNLNQYTQIGEDNYQYDPDGNLINDGTNTYTYDYENRLITATTPQHSANYGYDGFGRRISETIDGSTTYFIYDGDQVIEERSQNNQLLAKYVYGLGIDEVLTMQRFNLTYYYHYDGLGSVRDITNSNGSTIESYEYDVYGQPTIKNQSGQTIPESNIGNRYMFTGREYDVESGLYYCRARYYSPSIGRFLSKDPLGYLPDINLYRYCHNSPINFIDPFGLDKQKDNWWEQYLHEGVVPGPYGQPISEWGIYGPTGWGDPMKYTEEAGGVWMWSERIAVGISAATTLTALGFIIAGFDPWVGTIGLHPPHHGLGEHIEIILRIGNKLLKIFIPGKNGPVGGTFR